MKRSALLALVAALLLGACATASYVYLKFEYFVDQRVQASLASASLFSDQMGLQMRSLRLAAEQIRVAALAIEDDAAVGAELGELRAELPALRTILVLDPNGVVTADMREAQPAVGLDVSDRSYYLAHLDRPRSAFFIGDPVFSRVDGKWTMPMSLAARGKDGALKAVIVVSVDRAFFSSISSVADTGRMAAFLAIPERGVFLNVADAEGSDIDRAEITTFYERLQFIAPEIADGSIGHLVIDDRVIISRAIMNGEFSVILGQDMRQLRAEAAAEAKFAAMLGLALTLLFAFCAAVTIQVLEVLAERARRAKALEERLRLAAEAAGVGIWELNISTGAAVWDETMHQLYEVSPGAFEGRYEGWRRRVHPDDIEDAETRFNAAISDGSTFDTQFRIVTDAGRIRFVAARARIFRDDADRPEMIMGANFDVTETALREKELIEARDDAASAKAMAEEANARIEYEAQHDALTGLANRRSLEDRLEAAAPEQQRNVIVSLDLDRFKPINDTYGHAAGDALLRHVARRLVSELDETEYAARIGGDEFVAVLDAPTTRVAMERCQAIMRAMKSPLSWEGALFQVGVSIGFALPVEGVPPSAQLICADLALTKAKADGRNRIVAFDDRLGEEAKDRLQLCEELRRAVDEGQLQPFFQPQIDAQTGRVCGVEALARWPHPTRGFVAPDVFIPLAEELKISGDLDRLIYEKSLAQLKDWRARGVDIPRVSVNVSYRRLRYSGLVNDFKALTEEERESITFEILESVYIDKNDNDAMWIIEELRALGLRIELDDFGSGHTSVASILALRPDAVKLDNMFVCGVETDEETLSVLRSLIGVARSLSVPVIAEGVESDAQADILAAEGCVALQGFGIARPMPAEDLELWLSARTEITRSA